MDLLLLILAASLGAVFLWGLIAPRSQWRVLVAWSVRDPHANEPSGSAYGLYRLIAGLGIVSMAISGMYLYQARLADAPAPADPPTDAEIMWGAPGLEVVNRVVAPLQSAPVGLHSQPILGYQAIAGEYRQPPYLFTLPAFKQDGANDDTGLIGRAPDPGLTALDTARLVVHVDASAKCYPQHAVVIEGKEAIRVGVYFGENAELATPTPSVTSETCDPSEGDIIAVLIPLELAEPVGNREVQNLAGEPIAEVVQQARR